MDLECLKKINNIMDHWSVKSELKGADVSFAEDDNFVKLTIAFPKPTKEEGD